MPFEIALCLSDANWPSCFCECLAANSLVSQDLPEGAMADTCIALKCANSSLENLSFDIFARSYLFRPLIFERREFVFSAGKNGGASCVEQGDPTQPAFLAWCVEQQIELVHLQPESQRGTRRWKIFTDGCWRSV